jgi:hypothetical protein
VISRVPSCSSSSIPAAAPGTASTVCARPARDDGASPHGGT